MATLTLSLETSHAILTEAWEKFHEARHNLNEVADLMVDADHVHNRVKRLLWNVNDLKQTVEAIYALTPLPESESNE